MRESRDSNALLPSAGKLEMHSSRLACHAAPAFQRDTADGTVRAFALLAAR
jgi:hypothetical protein